jgi:hypothetical protein
VRRVLFNVNSFAICIAGAIFSDAYIGAENILLPFPSGGITERVTPSPPASHGPAADWVYVIESRCKLLIGSRHEDAKAVIISPV